MKKNIMSFLLGCMIMLCVTSYAEIDNMIQAVKVNYAIMVNGEELVSDLPILNYNESTYIPLRKVSEAVNLKVKWDSDIQTVFIDNNTTNVNSLNPQNSENQNLFVLNSSLDSSNPYAYIITGTVKNNDNKKHKFKVKALLYDSNKNVIFTEINSEYSYADIAPNDIEAFKINIFDNVSAIDSYELKIIEE